MENSTFIVQNWIGRILAEFDTLSEADEFKYSLSDDDEVLEDFYIIGIDENGKEFAPEW